MKQQIKSAGFAIWESLLLIVVVVVIAAVGYYVYSQRGDTANTTDTATAVTPLGTTDKTIEVNDQEIEQEGQLYSGYDQQAASNAVSDTSAMSSLEGAGNDSSL